MKYRLVEEVRLSGAEARIYVVHREGKSESELNEFIKRYGAKFRDEVKEIVLRLGTIGKNEGAREQYFKKGEGLPGDLVCALYDHEGSKLRLYCIRFGKTAIIVGGGASKPKHVRAWQDDPDLKAAAQLMIMVSKDFGKRMKEKEIRWNMQTNRLEGNLNFDDDEF